MFVPLCVFLGSLSYAVCVNLLPSYKVPIDAIADAGYGTRGQATAVDELSESQRSGVTEKNEIIVEQAV